MESSEPFSGIKQSRDPEESLIQIHSISTHPSTSSFVDVESDEVIFPNKPSQKESLGNTLVRAPVQDTICQPEIKQTDQLNGSESMSITEMVKSKKPATFAWRRTVISSAALKGRVRRFSTMPANLEEMSRSGDLIVREDLTSEDITSEGLTSEDLTEPSKDIATPSAVILAEDETIEESSKESGTDSSTIDLSTTEDIIKPSSCLDAPAEFEVEQSMKVEEASRHCSGLFNFRMKSWFMQHFFK